MAFTNVCLTGRARVATRSCAYTNRDEVITGSASRAISLRSRSKRQTF